MKKRYVLKNKKRFSAFVVLCAAMLTVSFYLNISYGTREQSSKVIVIAKGDTLWSIAKENNTSRDIRKYVYDIKKINNITGSIIYEGNELRIPQ